MIVEINFNLNGQTYQWDLELFPGFNKSNRNRWQANIFDSLRKNGSFLDETPDVIITKVDGEYEEILCAIEFCNALQAGNQAWQRSGRAFSTGRTGCPYINIVDFVRYELKSSSRERKSLRFPNPAIPYSYINFSRRADTFVVQTYVCSEEFQKEKEERLREFDESIFAEQEISQYIVKKMAGLPTADIESDLLNKNLMMVGFLATGNSRSRHFVATDWETLYENPNNDMVDYAVSENRFSFQKKISVKAQVGKVKYFQEIVRHNSVGLASYDLPFGIIPSEKRAHFASQLSRIYPFISKIDITKIQSAGNDLIICLVKGFKPRGDDNRPDRGVLPFVSMLTTENNEILTFIYGPIIGSNYGLLINDKETLADNNGLWKAFLGLSNYILLDSPILRGEITHANVFINNNDLKEKLLARPERTSFRRSVISSVPNSYHEDDIDTVIHYLFKYVITDCFEGMCNPPGGDWSGLSIILDEKEYRWLSLPRVSGDIEGKRPDHIIEIFNLHDKPILLSIESKDRREILEPQVGVQLKTYIKSLMAFVPSVERNLGASWSFGTEVVPYSNFYVISAAAFISAAEIQPTSVFQRTDCDLVFSFEPDHMNNHWKLRLYSNSDTGELIKGYIESEITASMQSFVKLFE